MLMSIPVLLYVLLFNYYPLWGWRYAFQNLDLYTIKKGADWIGLDNFKWLFNEKLFWLGIRNTLAMSVINLVFGTLASILLAISLNEVRSRAFKRGVHPDAVHDRTDERAADCDRRADDRRIVCVL